MVSGATNGDIDHAMISSSTTNYSVEMRKVEVVAAALPLQEHWLPLSNLDLLLPPLDVGVVLCYKTSSSSSSSTSSSVGVLKKALAQVLVSYYALAGEVVLNSMGEPEILCNNRGVDFLEAYANVDLKDVNLYNPDQSVEGKLVPKKMHGILAIQATELRCGSLVVGCIFDHRISDAYSFNMFLVSWAETAQSKPISIYPSFRRSLFNPRRHGGPFDPFLDDLYVPVSKMPPPQSTDTNDDNYLISRIYYVKAQELNQLQSLASTNEDKRTKLESFTAFLWQMIAKSANKDDTTQNRQFCKMGVVVDGRMRLNDDEMVNKSSLMNRYFGNVLSIPYGTKKVGDLAGTTLCSVANEVHDFLESSVTKEHFLGLIDWVEAHRPETAVAKIYCCGSNDGPSVVISSGQRFPITKADFGWGMPVFGSYHFPWGGNAGYVMPMPSPTGNGDWVVYMHLFKKQLEFIENEAAHFFKPFTFDYLISI